MVGAGSTGGYFGGRLAAAGRDVTFLVRAGRAAQLEADGLQIISAHGDLTLQPKLTVAADIDGPYDLILLAVKAFALEPALRDLAPAVGPGTLILPLLNGLRHIDRLSETFGSEKVLGGVCVVSTTLDPAGRVLQLADMQEITFGDRQDPAADHPDVLALISDAGFDVRSSPDITAAMWQKWMMLASVGAMNCLMRGSVGEIVAAPGGLDLANGLSAESTAIALAAGQPLSDGGRAFVAAMLSTPGSSFTTSMYRDLLAGQRIEVEAIVGDLVATADRLDVPAPLFRLALTNLSVYADRL